MDIEIYGPIVIIGSVAFSIVLCYSVLYVARKVGFIPPKNHGEE